MSDPARDAVITAFCRDLKLPRFLRDYAPLARQAADGGWTYEDYLRELLEAEVIGRRDAVSRRRLREAHFPEIKTLDQLDWDALKGVARTKVAALAACDYVDAAEDVVIAGPIGTGKTHLAIALGVEAARRRKRVAFTRAADLVRSLLEARDDRELSRLHRRLISDNYFCRSATIRSAGSQPS